MDEVDVPQRAPQDRLDAPVRVSVQLFDVDQELSTIDVAREPSEHRSEIGMRVGDHG